MINGGTVRMGPLDERLYGSIAAAQAAGISLRQLYYWVDVIGVVAPQVHAHGQRTFRRFTAQDVQQLTQLKRLLNRGYTLRAAARMVKASRS